MGSEHLAEATDERERGPIRPVDGRAQAEDPLRSREGRQLVREPPADSVSMPLVDHLEGDLGLRRIRIADEACDSDRAARLLVDRDDRLAAAAADVDEQL